LNARPTYISTVANDTVSERPRIASQFKATFEYLPIATLTRRGRSAGFCFHFRSKSGSLAMFAADRMYVGRGFNFRRASALY
jgi:hypothetical protein